MTKPLKEKLLELTRLRYQYIVTSTNIIIESDDVLGVLLRTHLLSEQILEELIKLVFEEKTHAILALRLGYKQKLDLVSKLELETGWPVIEDYIIGSLRKLNKLRNHLAHGLHSEITNEQVLDLFMNVDQIYENMTEDSSLENLKRYAFFMLGNLLPKYEEVA